MSLINDALKRAKQQQQKDAPPPMPGAPMRPVERHPGRGMLWPIVVGAILVIIGVSLIWFAMMRGISKKPSLTVSASNAVAPIETSTAAPAPAANPVAAPSKPVVESKPESTPTVAATNVVSSGATTSAYSLNVVAGVGTSPATTNAPAPVVESIPKLQGIMYRARRPSAVVSGKNVMIGSRVGEYQVVAIDQASVTVVKGGVTNVLTLPE